VRVSAQINAAPTGAGNTPSTPKHSTQQQDQSQQQQLQQQLELQQRCQ